MPAARNPTRPAKTSPYKMGKVSLNGPQAQQSSLSPACSSADNIPTPIGHSSRKRRPPNAFILFRSYIIANKIYPLQLTHQSDVSRYIAEVWRSAPATDRQVFFRLADEKKREFEINEPHDVLEKKRPRKRTANPHLAKPRNLDVQPCLAQSPPSDPESPSSPQTLNASPSHWSTVNTVSTQPLSHGDSPRPFLDESTLPCAPQPRRALPPSLLHWSNEADISTPNFNDQVPQAYQAASSFPASSHSTTIYEANVERCVALNTGFQVETSNLSMPDMDILWLMFAIQEASTSSINDYFPGQTPYNCDALGHY